MKANWAAEFRWVTYYFEECTKQEARMELKKCLGVSKEHLAKKFKFYEVP